MDEKDLKKLLEDKKYLDNKISFYKANKTYLKTFQNMK